MVRLEMMRLAQLLLLGVNGALGALTVDIEDQGWCHDNDEALLVARLVFVRAHSIL